jgi:hypothetical protein
LLLLGFWWSLGFVFPFLPFGHQNLKADIQNPGYKKQYDHYPGAATDCVWCLDSKAYNYASYDGPNTKHHWAIPPFSALNHDGTLDLSGVSSMQKKRPSTLVFDYLVQIT